LSLRLKELSRHEGVTLFMILLSAFQVLLARYTGQENVVVGTPIANRNRLETEGLIGFFVNTLVMRADLTENPTVASLLAQVRRRVLQAHAHQDVPFEKLVDELQPERNLNRTPLFQVVFTARKELPETLNLAGIELKEYGTSGAEVAKFDLHLDVFDAGPSIQVQMIYATDLFNAGRIERMLAHWQVLLVHMVDSFDLTVLELPMLTSNEQRQILEDFNATAAGSRLGSCIHQLIREQTQKHPWAIAVRFRGEELSYAELDQRSNQFAHYLKGAGVRLEKLVGICMKPSVDLVISLLAVLKAGGAYLPLDPENPSERLNDIANDSGMVLLITQAALKDKLASGRTPVICCDDQWKEIAMLPTSPVADDSVPETLAYVIYTSGSTGRPKGVAVSHRNLVNLVQWHIREYRLGVEDRTTQFAAIGFDAAAWEIWPTLAAGASLHIVEEHLRRELFEIPDWLKDQQITVSFLPTPAAEAVLTQKWPAGSKLRFLLTGGDRLHSLQLDEHPFELVNHYGPTENTVVATAGLVDHKVTEAPAIGSPISNVRAHVLDDKLQPVPIGVTGELFLGGASLARGYLNRMRLTAEKFIPDPFSGEAGARVYRTGDLVKWRADGSLDFVGRTDHQVKVRGYRVELGEIEAVLMKHDKVNSAVVVLDGEETRQIVAYVTARPFTVINGEELRESLLLQFPEYMVPFAVVVLDTLPLTSTGKVNRLALPKFTEKHYRRYKPPRTAQEEILAGICSQVLNLERVGIRDNFFEIGGHSVVAAQVMSRIRKAFHTELPLRVLFENPTIEELARHLEQVQMETMPAMVQIDRRQELPPSFAQQRLWFTDQLEPGAAWYIVPLIARLTGTLDVPALTNALNEVVRRHEILRTSLKIHNDHPVQLIHPVISIDLPVLDLRHNKGWPQQVEELTLQESRKGFRLDCAPLFRVQLLRVGEQEHVLLLTMHHIVSDGWSLDVMVRELMMLYNAFLHHHPSPFSELSIQYADFAVWQRNWLQGEILDHHLSYWRQELANLSMLQLPHDRASTASEEHSGRAFSFEFSPELVQSLAKLSHQYGLTSFMTLLAGYQALLYRWTGQTDIAVGSPVNGRNRVEIEPLIGFFVNMLVLRADFSEDLSFSDLLQRVRRTTLNAYAHQDLPFEKLVEEIVSDHRNQSNPLFKVVFSFYKSFPETLQFEGLEVILIEPPVPEPNRELTMALRETSGCIYGTLIYDQCFFRAETIAWLAGAYQTLLAAATAYPEKKILDIELSGASRTAVVAGVASHHQYSDFVL
jgi:amino acid adenylation domain-containing protein